jgi:hypothetical protein
MGTGAYPFRLPDRLRDVFGRRKFSALAQTSKVFPRKGLAISKRDQYVISGLRYFFNGLQTGKFRNYYEIRIGHFPSAIFLWFFGISYFAFDNSLNNSLF